MAHTVWMKFRVRVNSCVLFCLLKDTRMFFGLFDQNKKVQKSEMIENSAF